MVAAFQARRDVVVAGLNAIPGVTCQHPQGRVLRLPEHLRGGGAAGDRGGAPLAAGGDSGADDALDALPDVPALPLRRSPPWTAAPSGAWAATGKHYLRLSIATGMDDLREAVRRIGAAAEDRGGLRGVRARGAAAPLTTAPGRGPRGPGPRQGERACRWNSGRAGRLDGAGDRARGSAADGDGAAGLRDLRPGLPLALRDACTTTCPPRGHPGGSVSSGRFVAALLFDAMDYDVGDPDRADADVISYAAGHKALGPLRDVGAAQRDRARRRARAPARRPRSASCAWRTCWASAATRSTARPLFRQLERQAARRPPHPRHALRAPRHRRLGRGHRPPRSAWRWARPTTTASDGPAGAHRGGRGRAHARAASHEALAFAGTASLGNAVVHLDWNQASIDSNRVTPRGRRARRLRPVDADGALLPPRLERRLRARRHRLPGRWWRRSAAPCALRQRPAHGDRLPDDQGLALRHRGARLPRRGPQALLAGLLPRRCARFWSDDGLACRSASAGAHALRGGAEGEAGGGVLLAGAQRVVRALRGDSTAPRRTRWPRRLHRRPRAAGRRGRARRGAGRPTLDRRLRRRHARRRRPRRGCALEPGTATHPARRSSGGCSATYNREQRRRGLLVAAADLLGSTSVNEWREGLPGGLLQPARPTPASRTLSIGGICEDAHERRPRRPLRLRPPHRRGLLVRRLHRAARPHRRAPARHRPARRATRSPASPTSPFFLVCAHAGLKTGEDGPTHADPQPLQLAAGELPHGHRDHPHALGAAGGLAARGGGARRSARR